MHSNSLNKKPTAIAVFLNSRNVHFGDDTIPFVEVLVYFLRNSVKIVRTAVSILVCQAFVLSFNPLLFSFYNLGGYSHIDEFNVSYITHCAGEGNYTLSKV